MAWSGTPRRVHACWAARAGRTSAAAPAAPITPRLERSGWREIGAERGQLRVAADLIVSRPAGDGSGGGVETVKFGATPGSFALRWKHQRRHSPYSNIAANRTRSNPQRQRAQVGQWRGHHREGAVQRPGPGQHEATPALPYPRETQRKRPGRARPRPGRVPASTQRDARTACGQGGGRPRSARSPNSASHERTTARSPPTDSRCKSRGLRIARPAPRAALPRPETDQHRCSAPARRRLARSFSKHGRLLDRRRSR